MEFSDWRFPWWVAISTGVILLLIVVIAALWLPTVVALPQSGTLYLIDWIPREVTAISSDGVDYYSPPAGQKRYAFKGASLSGDYIFYFDINEITGKIEFCRGCQVSGDQLSLSGPQFYWVDFKREVGYIFSRLF